MFVWGSVKSKQCGQIPGPGDKAKLLNGDGSSAIALNASWS